MPVVDGGFAVVVCVCEGRADGSVTKALKYCADGLSVLTGVGGSFSAFRWLFCPGDMSFVATKISLLYPEMCVESGVNVMSDGHM